MEQISRIWEEALKIIQDEISAVSFETWVRPIIPCRIEDGRLYLQAENTFCKEVLEKRNLSLIRNAVKQAARQEYEIVILTEEEEIAKPVPAEQKPENNLVCNLNPKYVFDSFVIGISNRMAHAASLAVAEAPAQAYNPLFLYGNSGLGKTHLMHSIAHFILDKNPMAKVLYVTSETFTNELITSIQNNKNEEFRNKYRNIDVLLIDDIQFLLKKEGTQEELFHILNALHESNKQIVISSDRPPREIKALDDRLCNCFEWGLIADVQPPDYETQNAILRKKAEMDSLDVPDDVLAYIAALAVPNIRELEHTLNRVVAYAKLTNQDISISLAKNLLKDIPTIPTTELIQEIVAKHYGIRVEDILGDTRKRPQNIVFAQQIAMYLCQKLLDISLKWRIDESFRRDRMPVFYAIKKIERQIETDPALQKTLLKLEKEIKGSKGLKTAG